MGRGTGAIRDRRPLRRCVVAEAMAGRNTLRCRKRSSAPQRAGCYREQRGNSSDRDFALVVCGSEELAVLGGGLGERLLECALAAGLSGDRQLRGPSGDAAGERSGALAARDFDWCALTDLSEQSGAVLLR